MVPFVDESKIVEIIDHHKLRLDLPEYITYEIEEIGAAATLVADRFRKNNIPISRNSAILLYYGIMSNSFALKSSNTSQRDIEVAKWLEEQCNEISKEKIEEIFRAKSVFKSSLKNEVEAEIPLKCGDIRMTVGQLEIVDAEKFIEGYVFTQRNIVPIERLHKLQISQGPFDKLCNVARVKVTTAGGDVEIRFLENEKAEKITESLKQKINQIAVEQKNQIAKEQKKRNEEEQKKLNETQE